MNTGDGQGSSELYLNHPEADERAHGAREASRSSRFWLWRILDLDASKRKTACSKRSDHVRDILDIYPDRLSFPVASTWRQFQTLPRLVGKRKSSRSSERTVRCLVAGGLEGSPRHPGDREADQ